MQNPNFSHLLSAENSTDLAKMGGSSAQVQDMREMMTGVLAVYQPLFWQDALIAVQTGKPHKSQQREDCEKRLMAKGLLSTNR